MAAIRSRSEGPLLAENGWAESADTPRNNTNAFPQLHMEQLSANGASGEDVVRHVAGHVRQPEIAASVKVG